MRRGRGSAAAKRILDKEWEGLTAAARGLRSGAGLWPAQGSEIQDTQQARQMNELYQRDGYAWAIEQADALRRRDSAAQRLQNITVAPAPCKADDERELAGWRRIDSAN